MEIYKTKKVVKEVEVTTDYYHECDKCKSRIKLNSSFDAFDCQIRLRQGTSYPEGEYGTITTVDLCPKCAEELLSLLKDNGYRINENEIDD